MTAHDGTIDNLIPDHKKRPGSRRGKASALASGSGPVVNMTDPPDSCSTAGINADPCTIDAKKLAADSAAATWAEPPGTNGTRRY